jgi:hypothetical protein
MSALGSQSFTDNITTKTITDINNNTGLPGQVLSSTALGIDWITSSVQPVQQLGTFAAPVSGVPPTISIPYVSGFNKYILYFTGGGTGVSVNKAFRITGVPSDFVGSHTVNGTVNYVITGTTPAVTTLTEYNTFIFTLNDTNTPNVSYIDLVMVQLIGTTFTSGIQVIQMVITLELI